MVLLTVAAVAISLCRIRGVDACLQSHPRARPGRGASTLMEIGAGRTRFLALWGMVLGVGFALAAAITAVAFIVLPRCAG